MATNLPIVHEAPDEQSFWRKLARVMAGIPFAEEVVAGYYCACDSETPTYVRGVLFGAVAYFIMPIDMVPDILAGIGFTDDATVIAAALTAVGRHLTTAHREQARSRLSELGGR